VLLVEEPEEVRIAQARLRIFVAANDYVLAGGVSQEELRTATLKANAPQ